MELRCDSKILHGITEEDILEVTCRSARCGKRSGNVVVHRFSIKTGKVLSTRIFQEPKEVSSHNGTGNLRNPLRSA